MAWHPGETGRKSTTMNRTLWKIWRIFGRTYGTCYGRTGAAFPAYRRRDGRVFFWFFEWHEAIHGRSTFQPFYR